MNVDIAIVRLPTDDRPLLRRARSALLQASQALPPTARALSADNHSATSLDRHRR